DRLRRPGAARVPRGLAPSACGGRVCGVAGGPEPAPGPPDGRGERDPAALRGGEGDRVRPGRGGDRAGEAAGRPVEGAAGRARGAPFAGRGEGEAGGLRVRERRDAGGARRVRRERARAARRRGLRRLAFLVAAVAVLALAALYVVETKPAWYERLRYPLRYETI